MENTIHMSKRAYRETLIEALGGAGKVVLTNTIDRGHPNGPERFELTENGITIVYNAITDRKITVLFTRLGQIRSRYGIKFSALPSNIQTRILNKCREYEEKGYNEL